MSKLFIVSLALLSLGACSDGGKTDQAGVKNEETTPDGKKIPDFLALSKNASGGGMGKLTGVDNTDSAGPYVMREFFSDTLSFQLLFYPKNMVKDSVDFGIVDRDEANNYRNFICFAFVYPMTDPDKMKDYHADNTHYPATVKVWVRKERNWKFLSQSTVKDLTSLSRFKIRSIYSAIH